MNKHTPGPWNYAFRSNYGKQSMAIVQPHPSSPKSEVGYLVATIIDPIDAETGCLSREAISNARLIAAAPDLLAALEWVVTCCDPNNPSEMEDGGLRDQEHAIDRARSAIAKARGEG